MSSFESASAVNELILLLLREINESVRNHSVSTFWRIQWPRETKLVVSSSLSGLGSVPHSFHWTSDLGRLGGRDASWSLRDRNELCHALRPHCKSLDEVNDGVWIGGLGSHRRNRMLQGILRSAQQASSRSESQRASRLCASSKKANQAIKHQIQRIGFDCKKKHRKARKNWSRNQVDRHILLQKSQRCGRACP